MPDWKKAGQTVMSVLMATAALLERNRTEREYAEAIVDGRDEDAQRSVREAQAAHETLRALGVDPPD